MKLNKVLILLVTMTVLLAGETFAGIINVFEYNAGVRCIAFSPGGESLASGSDDGKIKIWDAKERKLEYTIMAGKGAIRAIAFSPDGRFLASAGDDKAVRIWCLNAGKYVKCMEFNNHKAAVLSIAFSPGSGYICSAGDDKNINIWRLQDKKLIQNFFWKNDMKVLSIAFSPDGDYLAAARSDDKVTFFPLANKKKEITFIGHEAGVNCVVFSPDGKYIATGSDDATARIWDTQDSQTKTTFNGHGGAIKSVSFSEDGEFLLTGGKNGEVVLWNIEQDKQAGVYSGHKGEIYSVAFSSAGNIFASAGKDKTVRLWSTDNVRAKEKTSGEANKKKQENLKKQEEREKAAVPASTAQALPISQKKGEGFALKFSDKLITTILAAAVIILGFFVVILLILLTKIRNKIPNMIHPRLTLVDRDIYLKNRCVALDIRGFTKSDNNTQKLWARQFNDILNSTLHNYQNYLLILMGDGAIVCFIGEKQDPYTHIKFAIDAYNESSKYRFALKIAISEGDDLLKDVDIDGHKSVNIYGNGIIRASRLLSGAKSEKNQIIVDEISYKGNLGNSLEYKDRFIKNKSGAAEILDAIKKHEEEIELKYVLYEPGEPENKKRVK